MSKQSLWTSGVSLYFVHYLQHVLVTTEKEYQICEHLLKSSWSLTFFLSFSEIWITLMWLLSWHIRIPYFYDGKESLAIVNCISYHIHCFLLIYFLPSLLHLLFMRSKSKSGQLSSSSSKTNNFLGKSLRMANTKSGQIPLHISACQNKFLNTFHKFLQLLFPNWNFQTVNCNCKDTRNRVQCINVSFQGE